MLSSHNWINMLKKKFKPILPSLREKKRYLAFEVIAKGKFGFEQVYEAVHSEIMGCLGYFGMAKAGIIILGDKWDSNKNKGIIKVNNKHVDALRASLMLVDRISNEDVIIRSIGLSGILKKAVNKYLN